MRQGRQTGQQGQHIITLFHHTKGNTTGLKSALCVFLCQSSFKGELVEFGTIEANKISFISNHKSFKKHNDIQALLKHVKEQEPMTCYFEKCINAKHCILLDNKKGA